MRMTLIVALLLSCLLAQAADFKYPTIKQTGANLAAFVPTGWHVLATANDEKVKGSVVGDLNGDKLPDLAAVLECDKDLNAENGKENSPGNQHKPRILVVLVKTKTGYALSIQDNTVIRCADEGGIFGDPFSEIVIDHGTLLVHFYGGSASRWDIKARFRLQQDGWYLIGLTDLSYHNVGGEMREYDYNLLTGKMKVTTGNIISKKQPKVTWQTPGKKQVKLADYSGWYDGEWQKMADHG